MANADLLRRIEELESKVEELEAIISASPFRVVRNGSLTGDHLVHLGDYGVNLNFGSNGALVMRVRTGTGGGDEAFVFEPDLVAGL